MIWHIPSEYAYERLEELQEMIDIFPEDKFASAWKHEVEYLKNLLNITEE